MAARALQFALSKTGARPLGPQHIPPIDVSLAFRSAGTGTWSDDRWHNETIGFELQAQRPFHPVANSNATLLAFAPDLTIVGMFVDEAPTAKARDQYLNGFVRAFAARVFHGVPAGLSLSTAHHWSDLPPSTLAGYEVEERYVLGGGKVQLGVRARSIPLCDGNAAFYVSTLYVNDDAARAAISWLDGLATTTKKPPVCDQR
jgi:hypothetical protein